MNAKNSSISYTVVVPEDKAGARLDRVLADALPDLSRTRIKALIEAGHVTLSASNETLDASNHVKEGEQYELIVPPAIAALPEPQDIPLDIIFEDDIDGREAKHRVAPNGLFTGLIKIPAVS